MLYKIKNLPISERPRERLINNGVEALSDEEIIAILIRTGNKEVNAKDLALEVLIYLGNIHKFNEATIASLSKIKGIGTAKATTLLAAFEFGKRILQNNQIKNNNVINADQIFNLLRYDFQNEQQEKLLAVFLDTKKNIIATKVIFIGTINASTVHPREIFKEAIKNSAANIILVHNHPSGDCNPSIADDFFTKNMIKIGQLTAIEVIDHIIFGNQKYYSYYNSKWSEVFSNFK